MEKNCHVKRLLQQNESNTQNKNFSLDTKLNVMKTCVWSTLLNDCEWWTVNKQQLRKQKGTKMWFF